MCVCVFVSQGRNNAGPMQHAAQPSKSSGFVGCVCVCAWRARGVVCVASCCAPVFEAVCDRYVSMANQKPRVRRWLGVVGGGGSVVG